MNVSYAVESDKRVVCSRRVVVDVRVSPGSVDTYVVPSCTDVNVTGGNVSVLMTCPLA